MIIEAPLNTRTEFLPDAPGPGTNKHWAVSEASLSRFNLESAAQQIHDNAIADAETYRSYHLGLVLDGPDANAEKRFVNRNADAQIKQAEVNLATNLAAIADGAKNTPERYHFFTSDATLAGCEGVWTFDAPAGFGELSYEDQVKIAKTITVTSVNTENE